MSAALGCFLDFSQAIQLQEKWRSLLHYSKGVGKYKQSPTKLFVYIEENIGADFYLLWSKTQDCPLIFIRPDEGFTEEDIKTLLRLGTTLIAKKKSHWVFTWRQWTDLETSVVI